MYFFLFSPMSVAQEAVPTLADVRSTRDHFPPALVEQTPLELHSRLSDQHGIPVFLKGEDRQSIRSYKVRGAAAKILSLTSEELERGVVCASAGNHAQGVAACCNFLKERGTIFMPRTTPLQKIDATRRWGNGHVEICLEGDTFDETARVTGAYSEEKRATYVHPFDDWKVIEGQGTVALEIAEQWRKTRQKLSIVIVPVGGGGLLAGTITVLKETNPDVEIIGVEPRGAASMAASIRAGKPVKIPDLDTFVDGAAVAEPGARPFAIISEAIREGRVRLVSVDNNLLCESMADLLQFEGRVTEPAGALSVAALEHAASTHREGAIVSVISGGNLDMRRMPKILEHAELHRRTKVFLEITLPDRPAALREMLNAASEATKGINICYIQFDEDEENGTSPTLHVGFQTKAGNASDIDRLLEILDARGYHFRSLPGKPKT